MSQLLTPPIIIFNKIQQKTKLKPHQNSNDTTCHRQKWMDKMVWCKDRGKEDQTPVGHQCRWWQITSRPPGKIGQQVMRRITQVWMEASKVDGDECSPEEWREWNWVTKYTITDLLHSSHLYLWTLSMPPGKSLTVSYRITSFFVINRISSLTTPLRQSQMWLNRWRHKNVAEERLKKWRTWELRVWHDLHVVRKACVHIIKLIDTMVVGHLPPRMFPGPN